MFEQGSLSNRATSLPPANPALFVWLKSFDASIPAVNGLTSIAGIRVGHATDLEGITG